ncbi:putative lipoprotein [Corallococcus coralloides]|uniref:Putative lipoprotein n=1 Tax=Corallococcus coralloides TaxID=184914 RepID=A0A410RY47_CORCK|nr:hypothetical protein [Corallococcus coralloides]QAT86751.1 putative lipoprotein [Corallococcus coralloides]
MKFRKLAVLFAACGAFAACGGGGGSLPTGNDPGAPTTNADGTVDLPGNAVDPDKGGGTKPDQQEELTTLWPLTTGTTWTYRITDDVEGVFDKVVTVHGPETVPGTTMTAVKVHSRQDRTNSGTVYEENSWQLELTNGLVVRLREEDVTDGLATKATTWSPAMMKSLAATPASVPWEHQDKVRELITYAAGGTEGKDPTYVWKVLEKDVTVTTPAGTFTNAIKVQRDKLNKNGEVKEEKQRLYWLVPGVGKVREDGERLEELVSYDVKKP